MAIRIGFADEMRKEWARTKASRKKWKKKAKKGIKSVGKSRQRTSDWIVNNINPDIYNNDADFDFDPWDPFGKRKKRR